MKKIALFSFLFTLILVFGIVSSYSLTGAQSARPLTVTCEALYPTPAVLAPAVFTGGTYDPNNRATEPITYNWVGEGINIIRSNQPVERSESGDIIFNTPGRKTITVRATDATGRQGSATCQTVNVLAVAAPVVVSPSNNAYVTSPVRLRADSGSLPNNFLGLAPNGNLTNQFALEFKIDQGPFESVSRTNGLNGGWFLNKTLSDGQHTAQVRDPRSVISPAVSFFVDNSPPSGVIFGSFTPTARQINLSYSLSDNSGPVYFEKLERRERQSGGSWSNFAPAILKSFYQDTNFPTVDNTGGIGNRPDGTEVQYQVTALDRVGNVAKITSDVITINIPIPPPVIESFTAHKSAAFRGETLTFSARVSNADSCYLNGQNFPINNGLGEEFIQHKNSGAYSLHCLNQGGFDSRNLNIDFLGYADILVSVTLRGATPGEKVGIRMPDGPVSYYDVKIADRGSDGQVIIPYPPYSLYSIEVPTGYVLEGSKSTASDQISGVYCKDNTVTCAGAIFVQVSSRIVGSLISEYYRSLLNSFISSDTSDDNFTFVKEIEEKPSLKNITVKPTNATAGEPVEISWIGSSLDPDFKCISDSLSFDASAPSLTGWSGEGYNSLTSTGGNTTITAPNVSKVTEYYLGLNCGDNIEAKIKVRDPNLKKSPILTVSPPNIPTPGPSVELRVDGFKNETIVDKGAFVNITWTSSNATACDPEFYGHGYSSDYLQKTVAHREVINEERTFYIICQGANKQTASSQVIVKVKEVKPFIDVQVNGSDGPVTLSEPGPVSVSWTSGGVSACNAWFLNQGAKPELISSAGTTYNITRNKLMTVSCSPTDGSKDISDDVQVNVGSSGLRVDVKARRVADGSSAPFVNSLTVNKGEQIQLIWSSENAFQCNAYFLNQGSSPNLRQRDASNPYTTTVNTSDAVKSYTVGCGASGFVAADTVEVKVNQPNSGGTDDPNPNLPPPKPQCSDDLDNDGDGQKDAYDDSCYSDGIVSTDDNGALTLVDYDANFNDESRTFPGLNIPNTTPNCVPGVDSECTEQPVINGPGTIINIDTLTGATCVDGYGNVIAEGATGFQPAGIFDGVPYKQQGTCARESGGDGFAMNYASGEYTKIEVSLSCSGQPTSPVKNVIFGSKVDLKELSGITCSGVGIGSLHYKITTPGNSVSQNVLPDTNGRIYITPEVSGAYTIKGIDSATGKESSEVFSIQINVFSPDVEEVAP